MNDYFNPPQLKTRKRTQDSANNTFNVTIDAVEYIGKRNSIDHPRIIQHEMLGYELGQVFEIPIPPAKITTIGGNEYFLSKVVDDIKRMDFFTFEQIAQGLSSTEVVFKIMVFDLLICNDDRHQHNFFFTHKTSSYAPNSIKIYAIDHDLAFFSYGCTLSEDTPSHCGSLDYEFEDLVDYLSPSWLDLEPIIHAFQMKKTQILDRIGLNVAKIPNEELSFFQNLVVTRLETLEDIVQEYLTKKHSNLRN